MKLTKKAKKGFTLVELIVVIAIIAILAAVSVAGYYGFIASANQSAADQEAAQVKNVIRVAAVQGANKGAISSGNNNTATLEFSYNWTAKGLEASGVDSENQNKAEDKNLSDLVSIAKVFGGMDLDVIALTEEKPTITGARTKGALGYIQFDETNTTVITK